MLLTFVSSILFQNEAFCGAASLNTLRDMVSTCKGARNELVGGAGKSKKKQTQSLLQDAVQLMVKRRPASVEGHLWRWDVLRFLDATHRFSIPMTTLMQFCMDLPADDENHLTPKPYKVSPALYGYMSIRFVDSLNLASKSGLKAAMDRRHEVYTKAIQSAKETRRTFERPLEQMKVNIKNTTKELKRMMDKLRKDAVGPKRVEGESELHKGIRLLNQLADSLNSTLGDIWRAALMARDPRMQKIWHIRKQVAEIASAVKSIVKRYKTHSLRCPAFMTADCLAGLN